MRPSLFILGIVLLSACKTTRNSRTAEVPPAAILESEEELPGCDDITIDRVYWVRSLNVEVFCAEGGNWQPRQPKAEGKADPEYGPENLP